MQLSTTFRHMDASQAVREYTAERLEKIRKYFNKGPISAHAVFAVERGFHHVAELNITLPNGISINAKETTEDMYSSIDLAAARIERQVRKWKEKIRDHKPHGGPAATVRELVIPADDIEPRQSTPETPPPAGLAGAQTINDIHAALVVVGLGLTLQIAGLHIAQLAILLLRRFHLGGNGFGLAVEPVPETKIQQARQYQHQQYLQFGRSHAAHIDGRHRRSAARAPVLAFGVFQ